jgi:hypothetical protein
VSFTAIVNTISLAADADRASSGGRPYADRAWLLRNVILPWYASLKVFDEVVVVGEFEEGPFHRYVPCPQAYHNVGDALIQRTVGLKATHGENGDWILFQHDDHLWDPRNSLPRTEGGFDAVLSPARMTRARAPFGERLNNGHREGYVSGHALLMRRWAAETVLWASVPPVFTWDVEYTKALKAANVPWRYAPEYVVWDLERGAEPWR